jgi:DeoR/GlpR family transcriptional regulator of sugar metabolism
MTLWPFSVGIASALALAAAHGEVTRGALAAACGISGELARQELHALAQLGLLRRTGDGRRTRYVPVSDDRRPELFSAPPE